MNYRFSKTKLRFLVKKRELQDWCFSISAKKKALICVITVCVILSIGAFFRYQHIHRFDSTIKLAEVYHKFQSDFHFAQKTLSSIPKHEQEMGNNSDMLTYYYSQIVIGQVGKLNPIHYWACCRQVEGLWICSPTPFTEDEYEAIFQCAQPLFQKTPIEMIMISPARDFIDFTIVQDDSKWSGFRDCIFYNASNTAFHAEEYKDFFYTEKHYISHCNGIPDDIAEIDAHWFAETTHEF